MATATHQTIYLVTTRTASTQRAHFAIFVPSTPDFDQGIGTLINVVGAPMLGYQLEFERSYSLVSNQQPHQSQEVTAIGQVDSRHILEGVDNTDEKDQGESFTLKGELERIAGQIAPPRISENFMAPVNDTTNKRCQEWTMEYIRRLVEIGYINANAIQVVQSKRDPPTHGVGLQPVHA